MFSESSNPIYVGISRRLLAGSERSCWALNGQVWRVGIKTEDDPPIYHDAAIVETHDVVLEAIDPKEKGAGEKPSIANPLISFGAEAGT